MDQTTAAWLLRYLSEPGTAVAATANAPRKGSSGNSQAATPRWDATPHDGTTRACHAVMAMRRDMSALDLNEAAQPPPPPSCAPYPQHSIIPRALSSNGSISGSSANGAYTPLSLPQTPRHLQEVLSYEADRTRGLLQQAASQLQQRQQQSIISSSPPAAGPYVHQHPYIQAGAASASPAFVPQQQALASTGADDTATRLLQVLTYGRS